MSGRYAIEGGMIEVGISGAANWPKNDGCGMDCENKFFVGAMLANTNSKDRKDLDLEFYMDSADSVPSMVIKIPEAERDRFFAYVAGAMAALRARDIDDEIDA